MPQVTDPTTYVPPCGHYTCSEAATEYRAFCADHWFTLPEFMRARIMLARDRQDNLVRKGRNWDKAMVEVFKAVEAAVKYLRCQDERRLPDDYRRAT